MKLLRKAFGDVKQSAIPLTSDCVCLSMWVRESGWQRILLRRLLQRWRRAREGRIQRKHCETGLFTQTGDGKLEPIPDYREHFSRWPWPSWPCGSYGDLVSHRLGRLQGHRIKNWKVRKFILRDDPAFMHYYDPSKVTPADSGENRNIRPSLFTALLPFSSEWRWSSGLHLSPWFCGHSCGFRAWRWAGPLSCDTSSHCHTATAYHPLFSFSSSAKKHAADGNFFEIITSNEVHYFLQAATSEERKDWIKAVQAVSKCGK